MKLPKVIRSKGKKEAGEFPVDHYSHSSFVKFCSNPILFKIYYVNNDRFDTAMNISGVVGHAFHRAMEVYYGGHDEYVISTEAEAIEFGLKVGMEFLDKYNEGFINWSKTIPNKQKAFDIFSFLFNSYIKEMPHDNGAEILLIEEKLIERVDVEWRGKRLQLPIPLKGYIDKVERKGGKIKIRDYKTCYSFSNPDKIDGSKIIQAITYYLLVYSFLGEEPYSFIFEEAKYTKNRDGSPQIKEYEIVYSEYEQFFDFYFRLYEDITRALNGEMVFIPNIHALFDNEVAMIAYIHRLDEPEELANQMKKLKVDNITDLLKKKIHKAGNMKRLMKTVEEQFVSAKNLNYSKMENEEKIQTKLLEHGMMIQFEDKIKGHAVDLYRYTPSIGLKMSRIKSYTEDIEQVLGTSGIRILAPIPDTSYIGFEVPRKKRTFPNLPKKKMGFDLAIGVDVMGDEFRYDVREAPHMLVAGATGAGKSVFLSSIITQLNRLPKKECEIHLFDPKLVELAVHEDDKNVVEYQNNIEEIHTSLKYLTKEMNERYKVLKKGKARSIESYNDSQRVMNHMPYKFVFIDEFGDLIMQNYVKKVTIETDKVYSSGPRKGEPKMIEETIEVSKDIERFVLLLAQKARAAGIHLIISTQRPSVDIVTGTIKANFSTKVAFRTAKAIDSQVLLDESGAEKLLGKGDMIFSSQDGEVRLQGYNI